jgi:thioredoxin
MFLHGGWLHLILNMWTLYLFGPAVEDRLGSGRFLAFYLACGLFASMTHAFFNPTSTVPALGASGAIAGVLGSFILMCPLARLVVVIPILFFPFFFEVPMVLLAVFWFVTQVTSVLAELFLPAPDVPVVVDFWAPWCGPGRAMAPAYARAAAELEPEYRLLNVNTDEEPGLAGRYEIRGIPTLMLFARGQPIAQTAGAQTAAGIVGWVRAHGPTQEARAASGS